MSHTKGELQIKKTINELFVNYWENGESFLIGAYHRPNVKEQAIINHLVKSWNSHDPLTEQRDKLLEALRDIVNTAAIIMAAQILEKSDDEGKGLAVVLRALVEQAKAAIEEKP